MTFLGIVIYFCRLSANKKGQYKKKGGDDKIRQIANWNLVGKSCLLKRGEG